MEGNTKFTFEYCKELALRCKTLSEFYTLYAAAYNRSCKKGWLKEYPWLSRFNRKTASDWGNWNRKPVAQYTIEGEFIKVHDSVTQAAIATGNEGNTSIIGLCCKGKRKVAAGFRWLYEEDMDRAVELFAVRKVRRFKPYTVEEVLTEAAKFKSRKEFRKKAESCYHAACRLGILDNLPFKRELNPYKDKLYHVYAHEFKETHSVYIGLTWRKEKRFEEHETDGKSAVYKHALENGLSVSEPKYLAENISAKKALILEDVYKKQYKADGWNVLNKAKTGLGSGSLGGCNRRHSKKEILRCVKHCETRDEFSKKYPRQYDFLKREGLLGMLDGLERRVAVKGTYNEEGCFFTALQYENTGDFRSKDTSAYTIAVRNGWLKTYFWLKDKGKRAVILSNPITSFEDFEMVAFSTVKEAAEFAGFRRNAKFERLQKSGVLRGIHFYSLD